MKKLALTTSFIALALLMASPSKAREVKRVVGYVESSETINERDVEFNRIDESGDGAINFNEFQKHTMLENEFEMFDMNDTDNNQLLTIDEFRNFSKWGPARVSEGPAMTHYNFNTSRDSNRY